MDKHLIKEEDYCEYKIRLSYFTNYYNQQQHFFYEINLDNYSGKSLYIINTKWINQLKEFMLFSKFINWKKGKFKLQNKDFIGNPFPKTVDNSLLFYDSNNVLSYNNTKRVLRRDILKNKEIIFVSEFFWKNYIKSFFEVKYELEIKLINNNFENFNLKNSLFTGIILRIFLPDSKEKILHFEGKEKISFLKLFVQDYLQKENKKSDIKLNFWKCLYQSDIPAKSYIKFILTKKQKISIDKYFSIINNSSDNELCINKYFHDGDVLLCDYQNNDENFFEFGKKEYINKEVNKLISEQLKKSGITKEKIINKEYEKINLGLSDFIENTNFPTEQLKLLKETQNHCNQLENLNNQMQNQINQLQNQYNQLQYAVCQTDYQNQILCKWYNNFLQSFKNPNELEKINTFPSTGIANIGNNCYINASLQCLLSIEPFFKYYLLKKYIKHINIKNEKNTEGKISMNLGDFCNCFFTPYYRFSTLITYGYNREENINGLYSEDICIVPAYAFKENICQFLTTFRGWLMQDISEFLLQLLDYLHEETKNEKLQNDSIIKRLFMGEFMHSYICLHCKKISNNFEPFKTLELPIVQDEFKNKDKPKIEESNFFTVKIFFIPYYFSKDFIFIMNILKDETVLQFRKTIEISLNIYFDSFVVCLVGNYTNSHILNKILLDNEKFKDIFKDDLNNPNKTIYIYQINPEFFVNINKSCNDYNINYFANDINFYEYLGDNRIKILNDFKDTYSKVYSNNNNNNGNNKKIINECLKENKHLKNKIRIIFNNQTFSDEKKFKTNSIPLIFYFSLNQTLYDIYREIIKFYFKLLNKYIDYEYKNADELLNDLYLDTENYKIFLDKIKTYELLKGKLPFILYYSNPILSENEKICFLCQKENCKGCHITPDKNIKIYDIIQKGRFNLQASHFDNDDYYCSFYDERQSKKNENLEINIRWKLKYLNEIRQYITPSQKNIINLEYKSNNDFLQKYCADKLSQNIVNINQCFKDYFSSIIIDRDCSDSTNQQMKSESQIYISELPNILIILLKRFIQDDNNNFVKNYDLVEFPIYNLDLSKYISKEKIKDENCLYDLVCVCNHIGLIDFGHYTSYCKRGDYWYHFNDQQEPEIIPNDCLKETLVTNYAYLLFYKKKNMDNKQFDDLLK